MQQLSLFISYRRTDSTFVDRLEVDLRVRGFDTWLDRRDLASRGGANWRRELQIAIDKAHALVFVLTPDAAQSPYVGWEYRYAAALGRPIFVLLLKDCPNGVPEEVLTYESRWINFRSEADYPRALFDLTALLMDLPVEPLPPRPDGVVFGEDQPLNLTPMGVIEMARPAFGRTTGELDEMYRLAVKAEIAGDFDRTIDLYERILKADPSYRNHYIGNRMPELLLKRSEVWIDRLGKIAYQARLEGEWGLEVAAWTAMLTVTEGDPRAKQGLDLAKHNQNFAWLYKEALSAYNNGDIAAARHQLEQLWKQAPDYGDPARLAPELGMPSRQARESTGAIKRNVVQEAQRLYEQTIQKKAPVQQPARSPELDELDELMKGGSPTPGAPFPLRPGEQVVKQHSIGLRAGISWSERPLYLTTQRIVILPPSMNIFGRDVVEIPLREIVTIQRTTAMMVTPAVEIITRAGQTVQFVLNELGGLIYGNREEFIALIQQTAARL